MVDIGCRWPVWMVQKPAAAPIPDAEQCRPELTVQKPEVTPIPDARKCWPELTVQKPGATPIPDARHCRPALMVQKPGWGRPLDSGRRAVRRPVSMVLKPGVRAAGSMVDVECRRPV